MIRIHYSRDGKTHQLHITGHAGYAPRGQDIVCAGISALSFALLGHLRQTGTAAEAACRKGELTLRCPVGTQTDSAVSMALTGYQLIAKTYPQYVEVDIMPHQEADTRKGAGKEHEQHASQHSGAVL